MPGKNSTGAQGKQRAKATVRTPCDKRVCACWRVCFAHMHETCLCEPLSAPTTCRTFHPFLFCGCCLLLIARAPRITLTRTHSLTLTLTHSLTHTPRLFILPTSFFTLTIPTAFRTNKRIMTSPAKKVNGVCVCSSVCCCQLLKVCFELTLLCFFFSSLLLLSDLCCFTSTARRCGVY